MDGGREGRGKKEGKEKKTSGRSPPHSPPSTEFRGEGLTFTPHIPILSTLSLLLRSNMANATTPAPLSLDDAMPSTYPVVYSPVPTINTLTFLSIDDMMFVWMNVKLSWESYILFSNCRDAGDNILFIMHGTKDDDDGGVFFYARHVVIVATYYYSDTFRVHCVRADVCGGKIFLGGEVTFPNTTEKTRELKRAAPRDKHQIPRRRRRRRRRRRTREVRGRQPPDKTEREGGFCCCCCC